MIDPERRCSINAAGQLLQVYDASTNTRTDYIPGPNGESLARVKRTASAHVASFVHADHLGTARAATSATGTVLWEDFHSPFGESLTHPDATDDQGDFTGHIRDKSSGLTYMQARYYDPVIGRFLSIDPVTFMDTGNPAMFNRYAYVENDPINGIDPTGKYKEHIWTANDAVTIRFPLAYSDPTGKGKTSGRAIEAVAERAFSGTFKINGNDIKVTLDVVLTPTGQNTATVDPNTNRSFAKGDDIPLRQDAGAQVGAHEIGHPLGARDHYSEDKSRPINDASGKQIIDSATGRPKFGTSPNPGFAGTMMGDTMGRANNATMNEIFNKPADKVTCYPGVSAGAGNSC